MTNVKDFIKDIQKNTPKLEAIEPHIFLHDDSWVVIYGRYMDVSVMSSALPYSKDYVVNIPTLKVEGSKGIDGVIDVYFTDLFTHFLVDSTYITLEQAIAYTNETKKIITKDFLEPIKTDRFFNDVKTISGKDSVKYKILTGLIFKGEEYAPLETFYDKDTFKITEVNKLGISIKILVEDENSNEINYEVWLKNQSMTRS